MRVRHKRWAIPEMKKSPYVAFSSLAEELRGHWQSFFAKEQPLHLDLGTGRAQFVMALAQQEETRNVLGVERFSNVLVYGARALEELDLPNARLLAADMDFGAAYFSPDEVSSISINFCNPWPKKRHQKRRLTHPRKLRLYEQILVDDGILQVKIDDEDLFRATLEYLATSAFELTHVNEDLAVDEDPHGIVTYYEERWRAQGIPIKFIEARNRKARG